MSLPPPSAWVEEAFAAKLAQLRADERRMKDFLMHAFGMQYPPGNEPVAPPVPRPNRHERRAAAAMRRKGRSK